MDLSELNNLDIKTTIITPSRRLATSVRLANSKNHGAQAVWETQPIYALDDWKKALWEQYEIEGLTPLLLLNPMQVLLRFEHIILTSQIGKGLLRGHQAAKSALSAWDLIHQWQCEEIIYQEPNNTNEAAFNQWAKSYQQWLNENQAIDNTLLCKSLLALLLNHEDVAKRISPNKALILYGFEELTPLLSHFFEALRTNHWTIHTKSIPSITPKSCERLAFSQKEMQYYASANWAKVAVENNKSVGIIVPNLADEREVLDRIFRDVFSPMQVLNPSLDICAAFNISAATPLIQYPLIFEVINFIRFTLLQCEIGDACQALSSVFMIGAKAEAFQRAKLTSIICKTSQQEIPLSTCSMLIKKHHEIKVPLLEKCIQQLSKIKSQQSMPISQWVLLFKEIITIMGWPGERALTSNEHQLVKRMDELFNEMMLCDTVLPEQGAFEAIILLQKLAANVPFQAENKGAKIQILGLIEAIGQSFDCCWVMGMDSEAWPPIPSPNPFISFQLQRKENMPHASAQRELAYASTITQRFKECADEIIFSYALKDKEKNLNVSELIQDLPLLDSEYVSLEKTRCEGLFVHKDPLESTLDERAPLLDDSAFKGTATTLQLQAVCPFKAFAVQRLMIQQLDERSLWLKPHEQGSCLHDVLEAFWLHFKSLDKLKQTDTREVFDFVHHTIEKSLARYISPSVPSTYLTCEKNRISQIIMDYIELEKTRLPFKVVATEQKREVTLAKIKFSIRLDRVDVNHQQEHVIIDYKTGQYGFTSGVWQERLETPQLPLYYVASKQYEPKAIVVIKVNSKACEFDGISESPSDMIGVKNLENIKMQDTPAKWEDLQSYWLERLTFLAQEFKSGYAAVAPFNQEVCRFCHLSSLCRINEVQA